MIEFIAALVVTIGLIILTLFLHKYFTTSLIASAILIAIAFIYVGFALKDNTIPYIILEISMAIILFFLAIVGASKRNGLAGYGILFHGMWDIFHHNGWFVDTNIPIYWPVFCFTIDLIYGLFLIHIFKKLPVKS